MTTNHVRGRAYPYFYCLGRQHDKRSCAQGYIPIGDIEEAVRAYWATARLPLERIRALRESILATVTDQREQGQAAVAVQRRKITELEQRRQKAKTAYYADGLTLDEFKAEQALIRHGIQVAEHQIAAWTVELDNLTQALDEALTIVAHPQALYDILPEGLKLIFVQTVFEKLWVLDTAVVGSELTEPFAELLTLEARLDAGRN